MADQIIFSTACKATRVNTQDVTSSIPNEQIDQYTIGYTPPWYKGETAMF